MKMFEKASEIILVRWLGLGRITQGVVEGFFGVAAAAAILVLVTRSIPMPPPILLGDLADIGIVLVLAYVLEAVWLAPRMVEESDYENRLGGLTGVGIAGMVGVLVALLLSAHRVAGHSNLLDEIGLAWVMSSLLILAGMVVVQPLLVHEWRQSSS